MKCPDCNSEWDGKTFTHLLGEPSCQECGGQIEVK